jgi:hypothetical protein
MVVQMGILNVVGTQCAVRVASPCIGQSGEYARLAVIVEFEVRQLVLTLLCSKKYAEIPRNKILQHRGIRNRNQKP